MTGSIKDYTPNFEFIIPEFNISGWHDYLEENFRSIDALFYNLFGINNFKGQWRNATVYNTGDVVFIGEDINYGGRLVKVLVQHTTAGTGNFTEFFTTNPSYYELFADASTAQIFTQNAKDWATKIDGPVEDDLYSSKYYANIVNGLSEEITSLYDIINDIKNVSMISSDVVEVSNIKTSVQNVANSAYNINTVASYIPCINNVSDNIAAIVTLNANISDINTVENNITTINSVATNITNINDVNANKDNINSVVSNKTNINNVANNITNINDVANNSSNISTVATNVSDISTNATNIGAINTNASNISDIQDAYTNAQSALDSKNKAQEWATSENIVDNTDYSAKHYANQSQISAELSAQYANDKINQTHITNCITEIPQDIKLELNNEVLTLKAGSKVYIPNGFEVDGTTPKFDVVVIENDLTDTADTQRQPIIWCRKINGNYFISTPISSAYCYSGSTAPTSFYAGSIALWYDTNTNLIKYTENGGTTWDNQGHSLPLAIVTETTTSYTSIDQVFNGFGYIGSTVYALPGVKGLIPNGRNADGSLKNIEFTTTNMLTFTESSADKEYMVLINSSSISNSSILVYDEKLNLNKNGITGGIYKSCVVGTKVVSGGDGRITSFTPKTAFHAVDRNDSSWLSGLGMPSNRYIDLTLGAGGSTYTAPANGWIHLVIGIHANGYLSIDNNFFQGSGTSSFVGGKVPMRKGQTFYIIYDGYIRTIIFRFIFAEGE